MAAESFAEMLRRFRTRAGYSQGALAERAELSEQAIGMLERGARRRPRLHTLDALVTALELTPADADRLRAAARGTRRPAPQPVPAVARAVDAQPAEVDVPRQLPPTLADFTGRRTELEAILRVLVPSDPVTAVSLVAVTGMGGVGKTSLAIHAAHLATDAYPDGHLYVDLRGYGPGEPIQPVDALRQLLRSLGVEGAAIPERADEAAALYRSRLAGLRVLILLDNANGAAQVRPLLPGVPGSSVIMTSRRGLTALPGVRHISLTPLPELDTVELLGRIVGDARVSAENDAARSVAKLIGHLPLAVRLVGARLAARPSWPIEYMVGQLENERRRLDELGTGDSGVRANIAGSVQFLAAGDHQLDRRAAAMLAFLGLPEGSDLNTTTVARLVDRSELDTGELLERLVDLNLLESTAPGRYRLHDLIRAYARERADEELAPQARTAALRRVLRMYTAVGWRSQQLTHIQSRRLALATPNDSPGPVLDDVASALQWLDAERSNISRAVQQADRDPELRQLVPELVLSLFGYHESRSRWIEMRSLNTIARSIAGQLEADRLAAWLEHDLAIPDAEQDLFEAAGPHLLRSLELFRAIGDEAGQARCCSSLSYVCQRLSRIDEALAWAEQALELSRRINDETVEGISYLALGGLHVRRGEQAEAEQYFALSISMAEKAGNARSLAKRYENIGRAYLDSGLLDAAAAALSTGIETFERMGDPSTLPEARLDLATVYLRQGDLTAARLHAERGLKDARNSSDTRREGQLLTLLGRVSAAGKDFASARSQWERAAALLHRLAPRDEAIVLELLAEAERTD
ncbi:putative ATPase [Kribbella amoyensis]|uniref:Putative ATPase n=1 Tax=Kribbella amoyensis TaxID=996641 RepID=A0A561B7W7_9ACTN|nr:helix-turn-helix domain-containing protein [Kribbella amoyensis]TWD74933.1 putative ATPase [Kribbella amoyensis]